jgi:hypothetical protein
MLRCLVLHEEQRCGQFYKLQLQIHLQQQHWKSLRYPCSQWIHALLVRFVVTINNIHLCSNYLICTYHRSGQQRSYASPHRPHRAKHPRDQVTRRITVSQFQLDERSIHYSSPFQPIIYTAHLRRVHRLQRSCRTCGRCIAWWHLVQGICNPRATIIFLVLTIFHQWSLLHLLEKLLTNQQINQYIDFFFNNQWNETFEPTLN